MKKLFLFLFFLPGIARAQFPIQVDTLVFLPAGDWVNSLTLTLPANSAGGLTWNLPASNGISGQVLSTNGANPDVLTWTTPAAGTLTSIAPANTTLTFSPNPITTTGTIGLNLGNSNWWTAKINIAPATDDTPLVIHANNSTGETPFMTLYSSGGSPIREFEIGDDGEFIFGPTSGMIDGSGSHGSAGQVWESQGSATLPPLWTSLPTAQYVEYNPSIASPTQIIKPSADIVPLTIDNGNATYTSYLQAWKANGVLKSDLTTSGVWDVNGEAVHSDGGISLFDAGNTIYGLLETAYGTLGSDRTWRMPDASGSVLLYNDGGSSTGGVLTAGTNITITNSAGATTIASTGGGMTNPMTTLGDIIYENATPAAARLAGNTTATKNFLVQTGTGSVSAAPAWGTIANADLPGSGAINFTSSGATLTAPGSIALGGTANYDIDLTHSNTWTAAQHIALNATGVTRTQGMELTNSTSATSAIPVQQPPVLQFDGQYWDGSATTLNQADIRLALTGAAVNDWVFESRNGSGAVVEDADLTSGGALTLGSPLTVPNGGTGDGSFTAYMPVLGGTTSTGTLQSMSTTGANLGWIPMCNGTGAIPTWQAGQVTYYSGTLNMLSPIGTTTIIHIFPATGYTYFVPTAVQILTTTATAITSTGGVEVGGTASPAFILAATAPANTTATYLDPAIVAQGGSATLITSGGATIQAQITASAVAATLGVVVALTGYYVP